VPISPGVLVPDDPKHAFRYEKPDPGGFGRLAAKGPANQRTTNGVFGRRGPQKAWPVRWAQTVSLPKTPSAFDLQRLTRFDPSQSIDYDNARAGPNQGDRMSVISTAVVVLRAFFLPRGGIIAEDLALRHQLGILQRSAKRPRLRQWDRIQWVWFSRLWPDWRSCLLIVQPDTVVRWHKQGFKLYWRWKSRGKSGRPKIDVEIRRLIRRMCRENATWGALRIHSELQLLGYTVAESTVAQYMTLLRSARLHLHRESGRMAFSVGTPPPGYEPGR